MLFLHMLTTSYDSLIAAAILAPFLKRSEIFALIVGLAMWDGAASLAGGMIVASDPITIARIAVLGELPILLAVGAIATMFFTRGRFGWLAVAVVPIALCFDNLTSYPNHPTTLVCAIGFGIASGCMAIAGAAIGVLAKRSIGGARA